ncbi:MAG: hypothetical protein H0U40_04320 [Chloroflexia bacterium]|nr:hypothetical protein [Chloroflexia bacterium]
MPDLDPATLARLEAYAAERRGNRRGHTWTVIELLPLLDPTVPVRTIAADLGVPRAAVTYELVRLRRAGFPVPERPTGGTRSARTIAIEADLRAGLIDAEAARRHGVSAVRVREVRLRAGIPALSRRWTEDERAVLIACQARPTPEVAALLGRSVRAIEGERYRLIGQGRIRAKIVRPRKRID